MRTIPFTDPKSYVRGLQLPPGFTDNEQFVNRAAYYAKELFEETKLSRGEIGCLITDLAWDSYHICNPPRSSNLIK